jgi:transcriptional accessory protein Tex/SPT6
MDLDEVLDEEVGDVNFRPWETWYGLEGPAAELIMTAATPDFGVEDNPSSKSMMQITSSSSHQKPIYRSFCQEIIDSPQWGRGAFDRLQRTTLRAIADVLKLQLTRLEKRNSILLKKKLDEETEALREKIAQNPVIRDKIRSILLKQAVLTARPRNGISPRGL